MTAGSEKDVAVITAARAFEFRGSLKTDAVMRGLDPRIHLLRRSL
jgi:hypothetical protein